jgi:hypothetical protein
MKPLMCEFESEVQAAVLRSRWPGRVDHELRAHVGVCAICSDVVAIAYAIDEARAETRACVVVPDSGRVWRLAQMRARREAAVAAGRPITAAQVIAFTCAVGLLGACFGSTSTWFQSTLGKIASAVAGMNLREMLPSATSPATSLVMEHGALAIGTAAVLLLVPAAVYLATLRD